MELVSWRPPECHRAPNNDIHSFEQRLRDIEQRDFRAEIQRVRAEHDKNEEPPSSPRWSYWRAVEGVMALERHECVDDADEHGLTAAEINDWQRTHPDHNSESMRDATDRSWEKWKVENPEADWPWRDAPFPIY